MAGIVIGTRIIEYTEEALNCPFCNSNILSIGSHDLGGGYCSYYVQCKSCGATGPEMDYANATKAEAIEAWNKRAGNGKEDVV